MSKKKKLTRTEIYHINAMKVVDAILNDTRQACEAVIVATNADAMENPLQVVDTIFHMSLGAMTDSLKDFIARGDEDGKLEKNRLDGDVDPGGLHH